MRWRIVRAIVGLESRLFLRSGYKQSMAITIGTILLLNAFFGIVLSLASMGVVFAIQQGLLEVEFVFSYLLLIFNGLLLVLLLFNTLSFLAIGSRGEDVELLIPSPVTAGEVMAGKMVWNFLAILLYVFIPLCGLMAPVGLVVGAGVASVALVAAILVMVAGSGLAGLLGCLLLRLLKPTKIREKLLVVATVASIFGTFIFQFAFSRGVTNLPDLMRHFNVENPLWYVSPATWAAVFAWGLHRGAATDVVASIVGLMIIALGTNLFSFRYAVKTYYPTLTETGVVPRPLKPLTGRVSYPLSFLRSVLGGDGYSIFLNEARMTRRDTYRFMQVVIMMVVAAVVFLPSVFSPPSLPSQGRFQFSEFSLGMVGSLIPFMIGAAAIQCFGFEGEGFQLLKSAPIRGRRIVLGKLTFYLTLSIIALVTVLPTTAIISSASLTSTLAVFVASILGCFGVLGFSMYVGVSWPEFEKVVTGIFGSRRMGVSTLGNFVYMVVVMLAYFFPNMGIVTASSFLRLSLGLTLIPAIIMLVIGIIALDASFRKAEELEVA